MHMDKTLWAAAAILVASSQAMAKLPPLDDAAKAKAAETAAKAAWQGKVDNYLLCKAQDKVVARLGKAPAKAMPVKAVAPAPAAAAAPVAAASGTTPVAGVGAPPTIPPCSDPGPFAYTPPEQKPLEASGAHSPPGTASGPPSTKTPASEMKPAASAAKKA
jgi:hypothetical protein